MHQNGTVKPNGRVDPEVIQRAMAIGVRDALRRHMLLGESVVVAGDDGQPKTIGPDEIRELLEKFEEI